MHNGLYGRVILCWMAAFGILHHGVAQSPDPLTGHVKLDRLTIEQGLSQGSVLCMLQDRKGLIWLGTRDGLNRYDGYGFTCFRHNPGDSSSLAGNHVNSLAEDAHGNIWVATDRGLSCFLRELGIFRTYRLPPDFLHDTEVRRVVVDQQNEVWAGTARGLLRADRDGGLLETTDHLLPSLAPHAITALHADKRNHLWVGTARHGVTRIAADRKGQHQFSFDTFSPSGSGRIEAFAEGRQGDLWVGTYGNGLFRIQANEVVDHIHVGTAPRSLIHNSIRALLHDDHDNLWVGTFDGLTILPAMGDTVRHLQAEEGVRDGLSHNSVRSLLADAKGSVWIGCYVGGVHIYDRDNQRFAHFYHNPSNDNSLSYDVVGAFAQDEKGRLWIGTERGGITIRDGTTYRHEVLQHSAHQLQTLSGNTIKSLACDERGVLWAGVFRGGLNRIDPDTKVVSRFPQAQPAYEALGKAIVNSITPQGRFLWVGTDESGGIHKFDKQTQQFISYPYQNDLMQAIGGHPVKQISLDEEGCLWLATRGAGIVVFRETEGVIHHFTQRTHAIPSDEIASLLVLKDRVMAGTLGEGLIIFDRQTRTFSHITTREGLLNNIVLGILPDTLGHLWLTTMNGLSRYDPARQTFTHYSNAAGFPLAEVNEGAIFLLRDGRLAVGGSNGYVLFDPARVTRNEYVPPVVFTDVRLYNKSVSPADGTGILTRELLVSPAITFNWHHTVFTIEFAALSFLRPLQNRYQYRLDGFDEDWREAGSRRSVTFTNLRDGTYTLLVRGANSDGVWNQQPARLTIHILPPPWKTWWAFVGYALLIAGGFWLIRYNAVKSAHLKHELKWEQKEKQRMAEMHRLRLQYFSEVSHEFRTPLTLIVSPLDDLLQKTMDQPVLQKGLRMMYYNCRRLLLLIDQILEIQQVEAGHARLSFTPVSVVSIVRNVVDSFQSLADHRNIGLSFHAHAEQALHEVDVDKLEKILFNLLSNAFKFSAEGGLVQIHLRTVPDGDQTWFVIMVSDTGRGMTPDQLARIFERFYKEGKNSGSGIGLSLTKSLVELMGGQIQVASKVNEGTTFTLRLPFRHAPSQVAPVPASLKPLPLDYQVQLMHTRLETQDETARDLILVVEDNTELRHYLKDKLSEKYRVITARNGTKGLAKAQKYSPQLIISDVMMEEMDGIALCQHVKSDLTLSHIPVMLLTSKSSDTDRLRGLREGADDYLSKPFMLHELELRVANVLTTRKRVQEKLQTGATLRPQNLSITGHDEKLLEKFIDLLERHLETPDLQVEWLSHELGLSRVHLFRKIKALTGKAPADFIRSFRLQRACQLLQQRSLRVAEVADRVGFQDVAYFSKCFKKAFQCTPSEYMQNHPADTSA